MPFLVVLVLALHGLEVHVKVVLLRLLVTKVKVHACIVALLQFGLLFFLVVVKVLVEVRYLGVVQLVGGHAVLKNYPTC